MVGVHEEVEAVRVVVEGGSEPVDVFVRADVLLSFIVDCHLNMPAADIYVEGELIDAKALTERALASRNAPEPAAEKPAAAAPPVYAPPRETLSLSEAKSFAELVQASLAALATLQIETFAACSKAARESLDEEMKRNKTFATDLAEQRAQHRKALHEIDIFDRGAHVAIAGDYAALRSGRARKPQSEGMMMADVVEGFFPGTKRSAR
jgi:hypothetical protein